jgi:hypothetical protein
MCYVDTGDKNLLRFHASQIVEGSDELLSTIVQVLVHRVAFQHCPQSLNLAAISHVETLHHKQYAPITTDDARVL